ncbi:MAG: HD domain-containing protein [Acidobacteria bacterium]|nr:HD domain-containing protein [Acidobacteriota bacterium]
MSDESTPNPEAVAVIDIGASAVRLVVAEVRPGQRPFLIEEASRGVLLGKDTFSSGKIGAPSMEAALKALEGFRRLMDTYGVARYRAVATSAVREASNSDTFLDRVQLRTGLLIEIIDGSEESRLTYLAVRDRLKGHPALDAPHTLLVEVGGGSADLTLLESAKPKYSGVYALGSVRMRQGLAAAQRPHDRSVRVMSRHIANIVTDICNEMPLRKAEHVIALGQDVRFVAQELVDAPEGHVREVPREAFLEFCSRIEKLDEDELVDRYGLSPVDAETLVPALLVYRALLVETAAAAVIVPDVSLRVGLLTDLVGAGVEGDLTDFGAQALASAESLGEKYRYDARHARAVASLATRLFDQLQEEHGLSRRDRLLLEVTALLHDIGLFVGLRAHHKHAQYLISASEIFGLTSDDKDVIANVARYHRRALPQRSHLPYIALDRQDRVRVNKLAAILRVANALDAEHAQKIRNLTLRREENGWVLDVDGTGDLSLERMASEARADLFLDVFGMRLLVRGAGVQS